VQEIGLPSLQPQVMPLSDFLAALFLALKAGGVRFCVLRNYEGFPESNAGNDIDFLISQSDLPRVIRAIQSVAGTRIVGYTERPYVVMVFLEGVSQGGSNRALELDFDLCLSWKGLMYLATDSVLEAATPRQAGSLTFLVPSPVHEAIISLLTSLLIFGRVKEKYFPHVQRTFAGNRGVTIAALTPQFGLKAATGMVDAVISGAEREVNSRVRPLRTTLVLRNLWRGPMRGTMAISRHYAREFAIRYSPKTIETVCIMDSAGFDSAATVEALMPILKSVASVVEKGSLRSQRTGARASLRNESNAGSQTWTPNSFFASVARVMLLLCTEWIRRFKGNKNLTLQICDCDFQDLVVDSRRSRYGGPMSFARLAVKMFPSLDLWILLDRPAIELQSRDEELSPAEAVRQVEQLRSFVKSKRRFIILDASQPAGTVQERAYAAIVNTLSERTDNELKKRFDRPLP